MTDTAAPERTAHTLDVPGATMAYTVRGDLSSCTPQDPPLLLLGSPMDGTGFASLAARLPDRVVVTVDPRNTGLSRRDDPAAPVTVDQHVADLHAVITALGTGPVDAFASSGGALNALALVAAHPDDLRLLVAHEPPAGAHLPGADGIAAAVAAIVAAYDEGGSGPAMARFITLVMHEGPVDDAYLARPAPDPAMFGMPTEDDGRRDDPLVANLRGQGVESPIDVDGVRRAPTRVVLGVGEESGGPDDGSLAGRSAYAVAAALGRSAVVFPGGHDGFLGGEFGQTGKPDEFAAVLRRVLAEPAG